jgi:hypothetical protein
MSKTLSSPVAKVSSRNRKSLRADRYGVESMPLQLLIMMAILALSIPIIMNYWMAADSGQVENNMRNQLDYLGTSVKQIYDNGIGNRDIIKLDFRDGTFTKVEYVKIGGNVNKPESSLIKWRISGDQERTYVLPGEARIGDDALGPFQAGSGILYIYLECKESPSGNLYVEIGNTR